MGRYSIIIQLLAVEHHEERIAQQLAVQGGSLFGGGNALDARGGQLAVQPPGALGRRRVARRCALELAQPRVQLARAPAEFVRVIVLSHVRVNIRVVHRCASGVFDMLARRKEGCMQMYMLMQTQACPAV